MSTMIEHPAESLRWYTAAGEPVTEIARADGKGMRAPDLRDARKLKLKPSVTNIISEARKRGLERWMIDQAILAAVTMPRVAGETDSEWLRRIHDDRNAHARQAAARGTDMHARVKEYFSGGRVEMDEHLASITECVRVSAGASPALVDSEVCISTEYGYGGTADLVSTTRWIGDLKGKETPEDVANADIYDEHLMQLAAYRRGLGMPLARCGIVFFSRTVPADHGPFSPPLARYVEVAHVDLQRGLAMFDALLAFWCARTRYTPEGAERWHRCSRC